MKKLIYLLLASCIVLSLQAKEIKPLDRLHASGMVYDMVIDSGKLYAATDAGKVDIFDTVTKQIINKIELPGVKDFMGDLIDSKVYSVDVLSGRVMMVTAGEAGYRNVYLHDGKALKKIIDSQMKLTIKEGRFIDEDTILLGLMSNGLFYIR